jgi:hypothetical protein
MRARRGSSSRAGVRTGGNGERKRLLVVEDNFHMGEVICNFLADHGMEPVGPATTLEQALLLVEDNDLDAALLDIRSARKNWYFLFASCWLRDTSLLPL